MPTGVNLVNYPVLNQFFSKRPFRSFSIKHVISGTEYYVVNGKNYKLNSSEYLITNQHASGEVIVDCDNSVKGLCIDLSPEIVGIATSSILNPSETLHYAELDKYLNSSDFLENKYNSNYTLLGGYLNRISKELESNSHCNFSFQNEFYFQLAEKLVEDNFSNFKRFKAIKAVKSGTKKELLRKLLQANSIILNSFLEVNSISQISDEVGISEFHFFRLYKTVFSISPYQLLKKKKLQFAKEILQKGNVSISETAEIANFSDLAVFSKSFKKEFGLPPSALINTKI